MKKKNNMKVDELKARLTGILPEVEKASPSVATQVKVAIEDKTVSETTLNDVLNLATEAIAKASEKQETKKEAKNTEKQKFEDHFKSINDCKEFLAELTSNPVATISPDLLNEVQEATMLADEELNLDNMVALCKKVATEVTKPKKSPDKQKSGSKTIKKPTSGKKTESSVKPAGKKPPVKPKTSVNVSEPTKTMPSFNGEEIAVMFPNTIEVNYPGIEALYGTKTFRRADLSDFKSYGEVSKAMDDDNQFSFLCAFYWTPRHINEYNYAAVKMLDKNPESFPNDLDLAFPITDCDTIKRIWLKSIYTDGLYAIDLFDLVDMKNPYTGETFKVRVTRGCEFEFYVPVVNKK